MSSDLTVPRIGPPSAATADLARTRSRDTADKAPPAAIATALPNPALRLDPALALVVIEFRDDSGVVRNSIPTQQQLAAYRSWDRSQVGVPPPGARNDSGGVRPTPGVVDAAASPPVASVKGSATPLA